jgi:tetratricopeptide (TPR) repeat protein
VCKVLVPLLFTSSLLAAVQLTLTAESKSVVRAWVDAALRHRPGEVDQAAKDIAGAPFETFRSVVSDLESRLQKDLSKPEERNNVRRRGALLHTDIALLLPDKAAAFKWSDAPFLGGTWEWEGDGKRSLVRRPPPSLVYYVDGQVVARLSETGHWPLASWLLSGMEPDAASSEFVRDWYRAVAATFLRQREFGRARHHLTRAREVLPRDPVLLFYTGAMHEGQAFVSDVAAQRTRAREAAPQQTQVPMFDGTFVPLAPRTDLPARGELQSAERMYREAVKHGASEEARIRLGRVLGQLGRHREALKVLDATAPPADPRLAYFHSLFLGSQYSALGHPKEACVSFERAATLFPTAQVPVLAISHVCLRFGGRANALAVVDRIAALPDVPRRVDPWWNYYDSPAADADEQLRLLRGRVHPNSLR